MEARLLEVDEVLLLRAWTARARREQRLPAAVRARVLPRGQPLPRRRRGELRHRPGRHHRHPAAAGPRVRRDLQRRHPLRAAGREGDRLARTARCSSGSRRRWPATSTPRRPRCSYVDTGAPGHARRSARSPGGSTDFPLDKVHIRGKTGSAEVYGKQSTSWVATYDENYVVIMMVSPGRHRLGHLRARRPRDLGGAVRRRTAGRGPARTPPSPAPPRPPRCRRSWTTARSCRRPPATEGE